MEITEIKVFPKQGQDKKLQAYVTVTFDNVFVVRNIKVIQGNSGIFIAMPSRKAKILCGSCGEKNDIGSKYCTQCGKAIPQNAKPADPKADHKDLAHPITQEFRDYLQTKILDAYEKEKSKGPEIK